MKKNYIGIVCLICIVVTMVSMLVGCDTSEYNKNQDPVAENWEVVAIDAGSYGDHSNPIYHVSAIDNNNMVHLVNVYAYSIHIVDAGKPTLSCNEIGHYSLQITREAFVNFLNH